MKKLLIYLIFILPVEGFACVSTPPEQYVSPEELISRTDRIVLARTIAAVLEKDNYRVLYTFETIKILKGKVDHEFTILGHPVYQGHMTSFNDHFDLGFWISHGSGRSFHGSDCFIHPSFSVGASFLIFLDEPYHAKSFEHVSKYLGEGHIKDKWLIFVEDMIKLQQKK